MEMSPEDKAIAFQGSANVLEVFQALERLGGVHDPEEVHEAHAHATLAREIGPAVRERVIIFRDHLRGRELVRDDHVRLASLGYEPVAALVARLCEIGKGEPVLCERCEGNI